MTLPPIKRVAVIGAGPAGAITLDALAQEQAFDLIRVFERREGPGGCWIGDTTPPPPLSNLQSLANRTADLPVPIPANLPTYAKRPTQPRFSESSVYPYLETNVDVLAMEYTQEPISGAPSQRSMDLHGPTTPFRHWTVMRDYVEKLIRRRGYEDFVSYNTTVERVEKVDGEWKVTLRKEGEKEKEDYWWVEWFDAVVVANGHYSVPYIPSINGLEEFEKTQPGSVLHSKQFRGRDAYKNKRVVIVGASVSAADIAFDLTSTATQVHAIILGHTINPYFGDEAFNHPSIHKHPSISHISHTTTKCTVHLIDGTTIPNIDHIIFGTGYTWTLPFLPQIPIRNNRVPNLYQHIVWQQDPTLLFVGAVGAGLTFKIFEWQAVYAARLLSGRRRKGVVLLPCVEEMQRWEEERVGRKGDGPGFTVVFPEFEEYFEEMRELAGGEDGDADGDEVVGRRLPRFDEEWFKAFMEGHELRKGMWRRLNQAARKEMIHCDD